MIDDLKDQGEMCVYRGCEAREHLLDITPSNAPEGDIWSVCRKHYAEVARVLREDGYLLDTGTDDTSDVFGHSLAMRARKEEEESGHA